MKKSFVSVLAIVAILCGSLVLNAQEKKGGKKDPAAALVTQFMKQLEVAGLTAEQSTKIKELYTKAATVAATKRTEGGITADILKKRSDASKAAKEAGKKGKEIQTAGNASDDA